LEIVEMARACIVGWAHTPFGKLEDPDVESLIARVSGEALKHAGVGPEAVNGIYVGVMNNGLLKQGFEGLRSHSTGPRSHTCRRPMSKTPV
jgi:acetyl-CoA acetyltransferase